MKLKRPPFCGCFFFFREGEEKKTSDVSPASLLPEANSKAVAEFREAEHGDAAPALLGGVVSVYFLQTQ